MYRRVGTGVRCAWTVCAALACAAPAAGQLRPVRTYVGVGRAVPVEISIPGSPGEAAPARLLLIDGAEQSVLAEARVQPGVVDLGAAFPSLWDDAAEAGADVRLVQLAVGDRRIGAPLVVQPLTTPAYAARSDRLGAPMVRTPPDDADPPPLSGLRLYPDRHVLLRTSEGDLAIRLRPDAAPNTAWNFRHLVEGGFYTDVPVHRVASLLGRPRADIAQTGDPTGTGRGGPGYRIDFEPGALEHGFGVLAMARGTDPNSAGSQFILELTDDAAARLAGRYAAFGEVVRGADTLLAIAATPVDPDNRPLDPPVIHEAVLVEAPPAGEGPGRVQDPVKTEGER